MKKHSFNQDEVLILGISNTRKNQAWKLFIDISNELGFSVQVSGGNFLTHTFLGGSEDDFNQVLLLTSES
tara:strand:- start:4606 stop:4815 length:210 start_codon:yes stop_codon:yes gene_type:complete